MKISYNWLKRFIDFDLNPREVAMLLTSMGIETSVVKTECNWSGVVTAKVLNVQKHPGADRLYLCKVNDGSKNYSVVCGAKNVATGQTVPLAKDGAVLPGNFKIKKSKIRGIESEGMICSEEELGLGKESEGILVLGNNAKIGAALEDVLCEFDPVLEVEITINRGDCLSYLGIAREIGAKLRKVTSIPPLKTFDVPELSCVEVRSGLCPRYIGTLISGVEVRSSPAWLASILKKSGIRSVNNIVDVTNYVMIELGQPLHTFDIDKFASKKIIVREAADAEKIIALDGREYVLNSGMLVIADSEKPVAIAGVMGGEYSGIDEKTETVFLESAIFSADLVRKTSRKLNLSSDSSYRFERGLSWDITELASWRAANLIIEVAGGTVEARKDLQTAKYEKTSIILRAEKVSKILGCAYEKSEIMEILKFLGIDARTERETILCTVPSWRNDIKMEVDLVEEVARIKGYDVVSRFPGKEREVRMSVVPDSSFFSAVEEGFRIKLNGLGFSEALNYSFSEIGELKKFDLKYYRKILNPVSRENEVLRPSLLPALYKNLLLNFGYGSERVALFEHGKIFGESGEKKVFAIIMCGKVWQEWWKWAEQKISPEYNFYFGGGIVRNILPSGEFVIAENLNPAGYYHSGKTAAVVYRGKSVGQFGILKPSMASEIKKEVFYFEIDLDPLKNIGSENSFFYRHYSKFPAVKRDISVVADKSLKFAKIENVIKNVMKSGGILKEYLLFSVYSDSAKLGDNKVGYSFRLSYNGNEKTLTDREVNRDINMLLRKLGVELGVKLRE